MNHEVSQYHVTIVSHMNTRLLNTKQFEPGHVSLRV
jgi:hypothetical protein